MKGKILGYNLQESSGVISAEDGNRYKFSNTDWMSDTTPKVGQSTDFVIDGEIAKEIYLEATSFDFDKNEVMDSAKKKLEELKKSEIFTTIMQHLKDARKAGVQHKVGFTLTVILILAYFLPVMDIPYVGNFGLWNGDLGFYVIVILLALAYLYYSGAKSLYIRIATGIILLMIFLQYNELVSELRDVMRFAGGDALMHVLKIGNLIIIPLTIALGIVGIIRRDKKSNISKDD